MAAARVALEAQSEVTSVNHATDRVTEGTSEHRFGRIFERLSCYSASMSTRDKRILLATLAVIGALIGFFVQSRGDGDTTINVTVNTQGEEQQEETDQQQQQQENGGNELPPPKPPPRELPNLDGIEDGARICASPECPEQYVVRLVGNQRFKRLLLSHDVVTRYGQFDGITPLHVSQDVLDAFETSCFVWFDEGGSRVYYHLDARPGTDDGDQRRVAATELDLRNAGIASAAFEVNEKELDYFTDTGTITLIDAMGLPCVEGVSQ